MPVTKAASGLLPAVGLVLISIVALLLLYGAATRMLFPPFESQRASGSELVGEIIQVEVRNGCGVDGLAAMMRGYLREKGFDVVEIGNHTSADVAESFVVDRVGNREHAIRVARALGLTEERVVEEPLEYLYLDASVILGHDYATLAPFKEENRSNWF